MKDWEDHLDSIDRRKEIVNKIIKSVLVVSFTIWLLVIIWHEQPENKLHCAPSNNHSGCDESVYDCGDAINIEACAEGLTIIESGVISVDLIMH